MSGNVHFIRNRAKTGTCFLLTKGSLLIIQAPTNITFDRNRVFQSSGLIVALRFSSGNYNICHLHFLTSKNQNSITLNVKNYSHYSGNCFIYSDAFGTECNTTYFTNYIHQSLISIPLFSSPPTALCLCGENMTCLSSFPCKLSFNPGQKFLSLFASDFENKPDSIIVYVDLHYGIHENVSTSTSQILDENKCTSFDTHFSQHIFLKIPILLD